MKITLDIECGEATCASRPGEFCQFLRTSKFGLIYYCAIWHEVNSKGTPIALREKHGWLLRRQECFDAEEGLS